MGIRWTHDSAGEARLLQSNGSPMREVVEGLMCVLSTGCQWQGAPGGLAAAQQVHGYFDLWNWDGTLERIHNALYVKCREKAGREASPMAAIIESQSVKGAEKRGAASTLAAMMRARESKTKAPRSCRYARLADAPSSTPPTFKTLAACRTGFEERTAIAAPCGGAAKQG
jgi:transposase